MTLHYTKNVHKVQRRDIYIYMYVYMYLYMYVVHIYVYANRGMYNIYNLSFEFWQTGDRSIQKIVRSSTAHIYVCVCVCVCVYMYIPPMYIQNSVTFNVSLPCGMAGLVNIHMYRLPSWSKNRRVASTRWGIVDRNLYR